MPIYPGRSLRAALAGSLVFGGVILPLGWALDSPSASAATIIGCSNFPNASSADIAALKDALAGSNTVNLTAGCNYILTTVDNTTFNPTGLPVITGNVTINGNSSVILRSSASGTPIFQILAIASGGSLTVNDLTIGNGGAGNQGPNPDPNGGGGIWNEGTVAVTDTNITNDDCFDGCGFINAGSASVTDSNISSNISYNRGAAITNDNGTMTISNSTIANNFEASGAGALCNDYGTMTISDSTIAGNSAAFSYEIGGIAQDNGTVTMAATILANGPNGNCESGSYIDKGYNIADDGSCDLSAVGSISNSNDIDGSLGPLGNNGGQTEILLPAVTSPAVGVIPNPTTLNGVQVCPRVDQRGVASVGNCTIGAVEIAACTAGLHPHLLNASYATGTFTGLFCVNAKGFGTYTQGILTGFGWVTIVKGTTAIAALGKNLFLVGATKGTRSSFLELAPTPIKFGTFTLS